MKTNWEKKEFQKKITDSLIPWYNQMIYFVLYKFEIVFFKWKKNLRYDLSIRWGEEGTEGKGETYWHVELDVTVISGSFWNSSRGVKV